MARADVIIPQSEFNRFANFAKRKIMAQISLAIKNIEKRLIEEAQEFAKIFLNTPEFQALKSDPITIGKFGFTREEISKLDAIASLLVPGPHDVTKIDTKSSTNTENFSILSWVDLESLYNHELSNHELTKFNKSTGQFEVTEVVSWTKWLQEGVNIFGHTFSRNLGLGGLFSRSGQGLMIQSGSTFFLRPTRIFSQVGNSRNRFKSIGEKEILMALKRI